jgi:hypothetical protein
MIAVCFFVDARGRCGKEIKTEEWLSVCRTFDVDMQLVIDRTNTKCFSPSEDSDHPAEVYASIEAVFAKYPDASYVMIERQAPNPIAPTLLEDFQHPQGDVIYCFGPDSGGLEGLNPPNASWVILDMSENTRWGMWALMAGTLVMHNRWKRGDT